MLISREKNRFTPVDDIKVSLGQFQTTGASWLTKHVRAFICSQNPRLLYDPFAGEGSLLRLAGQQLSLEVKGCDIDDSMGWTINDSLRYIPPCPGAVIVTNPPYLAKHSAKRKRVHDAVADHYTQRADLYQLALDRCLAACPAVVAIVPETIINSDYPKTYITSITILEINPFSDTDCPVCVVCMNKRRPALHPGPSIFLGDKELGLLSDLERKRLHPKKDLAIDFNVKTGRIALRAVDLPSPVKPIQFMRREECDYPVDMIKVSSRLVTFIEIPSVDDGRIDQIISDANNILARYRADTKDVLLSPFKGNTREGRRRRRLDYYTARAILERACGSVKQEILLFPDLS